MPFNLLYGHPQFFSISTCRNSRWNPVIELGAEAVIGHLCSSFPGARIWNAGCKPRSGRTDLDRGDVELTVLDIRKGKVELGFLGPPEVPIHRDEVVRRIGLEKALTTAIEEE